MRMEQSEQALAQELRAFIPTNDDSDWGDVQRRSRHYRARRVPRRARVLLVAATIGLAIVAVPATGLGGRIIDLFTGESAPAEIEALFAQAEIGAPPGMAPGVIADDVHKLMSVQTPAGRSATLWVAPTESGGWCTWVQREGEPVKGGPGCTTAGVAPEPVDWALNGLPESGEGSPLLYGRADADVTSIEVVLDNGDTSALSLTKGFFLYGIPEGRQPTELVATKEDGKHRVPVQAGMGIFP
jgi:hypothetical protein